MQETETRLIIERPSERAVKLAKVIYFTSVQAGEPYVYISVKQLCKLFDNCNEQNSKALIIELLEELREPIAVSDFIYKRKKIAWQAISFLDYKFAMEDDEEYIDIEFNEMFIEVMLKLEVDYFIELQ